MRGGWALLVLLVLLAAGCRRPAPQPIAARVVVRFLDRDAVLSLQVAPSEGAWRVMNAGAWEPLEVRWKPGVPAIGAAVVGRTAPDWVLLEDPSGETHRVVMRGPGPEELSRRNQRLDPDDMEALSVLGILWALSWRAH